VLALRGATLGVARITTAERRATKITNPSQTILCDPAGQGRGAKFEVGREKFETGQGRGVKFQILDFRFRISDLRFEISDLKFQI